MQLTKKQLKRLPYHVSALILASGASLILGLLSFGGMFALWPILPVAFAAFGLSVAYEGEIYLQNIKGALKKLFKHRYLERQLANEYLLEHFPNTSREDCPQFFIDYEIQLARLHTFGHNRLDKNSLAQKKRVQKTLSDLEKWFAHQLFSDRDDEDLTDYEKELRQWLACHQQEHALMKHQKRRKTFTYVQGFCAISGFFMSLGTTYLLMEAFSTIPFMAAIPVASWPLMIVPMAVVAGAAYALLTYNAVTDMISNDTLQKWYQKIRNDLREGLSIRNAFMVTTTIVLVGLALALTICTAGTWWTVAKETRPLFTWMRNMPGFIMGIINPIITGLSAVVFNLQNTSESLEMIDEAMQAKGSVFTRTKHAIIDGFNHLRAHENWLQMFNPFRLLLKITLVPLRILLFLGHLVSIGVTSDRVPGVSQTLSALLGIISEGFEDAHYFLALEHGEALHGDEALEHHALTRKLLEERFSDGHGHDHGQDLPTRFLKMMFSPLYLLAASWDYFTSQFNEKPRQSITFTRAWDKQMGLEEAQSITLPAKTPKPSSAWTIEHALYRIERHKEKQLTHAWINQDLAQEKHRQLSQLQSDLRQLDSKDITAVKTRLANEDCTLYRKHRFFGQGPTSTTSFVERELPERLDLSL